MSFASRRSVLALCIAGLLSTGACVLSHRATRNDSPHIDSIRPDTVVVRPGAVVEVVISGQGFAPGAPGTNTLEFAGAPITAVPSNAGGTEIRFAIPDVLPSVSEAPPERLASGTYALRVITRAGASNAKSITVIR